MQTRKPTGRAPWPITLIAGAEKAGKSWAAAEATGHPLIRDAYWLGIGEDDPDEYGQVPGADFSIIEHDGTYGAIRAALQEVTSLVQDPAQPDLLIVDSMGRLWAQLSDMAQAEANQRAAEKAAKYRRAAPDDDVQIGMDLWNRAKGRWGDVLDLLRAFPGPVIVTARLSVVSVMDAEGEPTKEKVDKVEAEKNLVYDVGAVVKLHARGQALLEGVRSARLQLERPTPLKDFSMA
ncbi:MAG: ATP-binding protein, partial [Brachybacterium sp.]|nr:ATP-binding protein [Brachybacterium sp.]